jgi:hypothetical protein
MFLFQQNPFKLWPCQPGQRAENVENTMFFAFLELEGKRAVGNFWRSCCASGVIFCATFARPKNKSPKPIGLGRDGKNPV